MKEFTRALELAGSDTIAKDELVEYLRLMSQTGSLSYKATKTALADLNAFMQQYAERIEGDFPARFRRALQKDDPLAAKAEIQLAKDLLDGNTPLGSVSSVRGLQDGVQEGVQTPEYLAKLPTHEEIAIEVKATKGLSKNGLKNNLKKAASQVKTQLDNQTGGYGYIRIDAVTRGVNTSMTEAEMLAHVQSRLSHSIQAGTNRIKFIEVQYLDNQGAKQTVVFEIRDTITIQ